MEIKCEYCGNLIDDSLPNCLHCGAPNNNMSRSASNIPKTIEELQNFCVQKHIDLERLHFHIGEDYREPKAFGIYHDESTGDFVVYKNKADGTRAIRYKGKDEDYAVNEIYQKLKAEILEVKRLRSQTDSNMAQPRSTVNPDGSFSFHAPTRHYERVRRRSPFSLVLVAALFLFSILVVLISSPKRVNRGNYYVYNGSTYYLDSSNDWYIYDGGDWYETDVDDDLSRNYSSYLDDDYSGTKYDGDYETSNNWSDDWDDDDWSWGSSSSDSSWDSGTDWDSDW